MKDKNSGKIIERPYLFSILIAIPIVIINLIYFNFFNFGAIGYAIFSLIGFYFGKTIYFRYFNKKKS